MYSPEFEKVIPLKIMLIHKDCAQATCMIMMKISY